jgi:purine-binding chemotaxis protein CheW
MPEQTVVAADEQVVVFEVDAESYGVAISAVQEIIRTPVITIVPRAPEHVAGVINLRGRVIPVIDLRIRFRLPPREAGRDSRVVVMDVDGQTVGAWVDGVSEVRRIPAEAIEAPGATLAGEATHLRAIAKVDDRLIILLHLDKVLEPPQFDLDPSEDAAVA